jgi:RimJ/RimL family protein N-acetyltransferase
MNPTTPRLVAEKLDPSHLGDLTTLHLDPEVGRYVGGVRSPEATADYLARNLAHWAAHDFGLWVFRTNDGRFAGRAGIRHIVLEDRPEVEIAYAFRREMWGQGLATEVSEALTGIWHKQLSLPSLVGIACVENVASWRVLEKTGFIYEKQAIDLDEVVAVTSSGDDRCPHRVESRHL